MPKRKVKAWPGEVEDQSKLSQNINEKSFWPPIIVFKFQPPTGWNFWVSGTKRWETTRYLFIAKTSYCAEKRRIVRSLSWWSYFSPAWVRPGRGIPHLLGPPGPVLPYCDPLCPRVPYCEPGGPVDPYWDPPWPNDSGLEAVDALPVVP